MGVCEVKREVRAGCIEYVNPYPNCLYQHLDHVSHLMMAPWRYLMDTAISCFIPTTEELRHPVLYVASCILVFPTSVLLSLVVLPLGLCGLLVFILICDKRKPYRLSINHSITHSHIQLKSHYSLSTSNVCLLQEFLSKFNNLSNTYNRAVKIGQVIRDQQLRAEKQHNPGYVNGFSVNGRHRPVSVHSNGFHRSDNGYKEYKHGMDVEVKQEFPVLDLMLFQETWDTRCAEALASHLHHVFPYIIYDVGEHGLWKNGYMNNSALMLASHYPILDVRFARYTDSCRQCRLASKGLLQVKVLLGKRGDKTVVGYINNTHLQVYQGKHSIHKKQLDQVNVWTSQFIKETLSEDEELLFDILGGDFNLDNMCPVDRDVSHHPIFSKYVDVCRKSPGKDHDFTIGTAMRQTPLLDRLVSTPEGLYGALCDSRMRRYYIQDADLTNVSPATCRFMPPLEEDGWPEYTPTGGRRRLDYLLYSSHTPVMVRAYNPVTLLAGLTDHVPLSFTIQCHTEPQTATPLLYNQTTNIKIKDA